MESEQRVVEGSLQRVAQRVDDGAHETVAAGNVPDFLDAETVGALLALQVKAAGNILGERTQDAFSENGELAVKSVAALEVFLRLAVFVDAFVCCDHSFYLVVLVEQRGGGSVWKDVHSLLLRDGGQPATYVTQTHNVALRVLHVLWNQQGWNGERVLLTEEKPHRLLFTFCWLETLAVIRRGNPTRSFQLGMRSDSRVCPPDSNSHVGSNAFSLFQYTHRQIKIVLRGVILQSDCRRQSRTPSLCDGLRIVTRTPTITTS